MNDLLFVQMHGAPGSGKSTLARGLGAKLGAVVVDKDILSSGALAAGVPFAEAGRVAYSQAWLLLQDLLRQGRSVIHDSPCFWPIIEERGREIAAAAKARYVMVETVCPDEAELERRVMHRDALPSQLRVLHAGAGRPGMYEPSCCRLIVDGRTAVANLVRECLSYLSRPAADDLHPSPLPEGEGGDA